MLSIAQVLMFLLTLETDECVNDNKKKNKLFQIKSKKLLIVY